TTARRWPRTGKAKRGVNGRRRGTNHPPSARQLGIRDQLNAKQIARQERVRPPLKPAVRQERLPPSLTGRRAARREERLQERKTSGLVRDPHPVAAALEFLRYLRAILRVAMDRVALKCPADRAARVPVHIPDTSADRPLALPVPVVKAVSAG